MSSDRRFSYDVVIIGAGLAGLVAAARASTLGMRVGVVSLSSGNLALWSGLVTARRARATVGRAGEAARFFTDFSRQAGLPFQAAAGGLRLLSASGAAVKAALAPATMVPAVGDLFPQHQGRDKAGLLVVGFTECGDYPAALIASEAAKTSGAPTAHRSLSLGSQAGRGIATHVAALFDDREWFAAFRDSSKRVLQGSTADVFAAVAFPPVLGLLRFRENVAELSSDLGRPVFELPAVPPSVPGRRFWTHWRHQLETDGAVGFHIGRRVSSARFEDERCISVSDGLSVYEAGAFILATGGVAGGGIEVPAQAFFALSGGRAADDLAEQARPREVVFGLETSGEGTSWKTWGVRTGRDGRPVRSGDGDARPPSNVLAAGWSTGTDKASPPDAMLSIETGYAAAEAAAALLGRVGVRSGDCRSGQPESRERR